MSIIARKYARRQRLRRQQDRIEAQKAHDRADLITEVKEGAMKLATATKSRRDMPDEFISLEFDELTPERQISILEDYISQLRELGARLSKEYADNEGAQEELGKVKDRIDAAGELIVKISLETIKPKV